MRAHTHIPLLPGTLTPLSAERMNLNITSPRSFRDCSTSVLITKTLLHHVKAWDCDKAKGSITLHVLVWSLSHGLLVPLLCPKSLNFQALFSAILASQQQYSIGDGYAGCSLAWLMVLPQSSGGEGFSLRKMSVWLRETGNQPDREVYVATTK